MKKYNQSIFIFTLSAILLLMAGACKKYLVIEPQSAFDDYYVFSTVPNATSALLGVYNRLTGDGGYGSRLSLFYPMDADDMIGALNSSAGGGDNGPKSLSRYNATPSNSILEAPFNQLWSGIESANICIKKIPAMSLYTTGTASEQKELRRLYGEALTLRAQFYFELIRNWGDVPEAFKPSADETDLFKPKVDHDEIYDRLLKDLLEAESLVPWRKETGVAKDERITKGAVKALRARIALFRGGYSLRRNSNQMERRTDYLDFYKIARDECNDIILSGQHALNPQFITVFRDVLDAHLIDPVGEVMFEVAMAGGGTADSRLGNIDGPRIGANLGGNNSLLIPTYYYGFNTLDTRRDVTACDYNISTAGFKTGQSLTQVVSGKFRRDWIINPAVPLSSAALYFGVNWPIIRYADVLLMFAEAENEINNGPTADAVKAFEQVRKRAFAGNENMIGVTPADKAGFFDAIAEERKFEFGGEGIRKYDLIRWNLLGTKLLETRASLTKFSVGQAPYTNIPRTRYYKNSSTDLVWSNPLFGAPPATAPSGYTLRQWAADVSVSYIPQPGELFKANHSEVLPLPQSAINSNPKLKQDYGY
jgi:hypothetical protein